MPLLRSTTLFLTFALAVVAIFPFQATPQPQKTDDGVMLDFEDVDIRTVVRFMAELTGRNFIVDNRVTGKVTVVSPKPVKDKDALAIFESLLGASGFGIVKSGDVYQILPLADAGKSAVEVYDPEKDKALRPGQIVTRIIQLKSISANSLVATIQPLLSPQAVLSSYLPNNTLIITDNAANIARVLTIVSQLDKPSAAGLRAVDIIYLRHADADDLAKVINSMIQTGGSEGDDKSKTTGYRQLAAFRGQVAIEADSDTNALVISAEPDDLNALKDIITRLDIRRLQVYLEALVMEVSADVADQFGVEWRSAESIGGDSGIAPFGGTSFGSGINDLANNPLALPQGFAFGVSGGNIRFRGQEYANIALLLRALKSDSRINVLATPQLLTLDNDEAEIIVGDNVPFLTGKFTTDTGGGGNPFQTIERRDVGLTLRIKPQISENGFVRLNIFQEISSIATQAGAADLITRKRSLRTTVVLPNDSMVALGGLIRDDVTQTNQQVPCLGGVAGAGELFRNTAARNQKTNLMVFIRPRIINNYGDMDTITTEKYLQMRHQQKETKYEGSSMVPEYQQPEPAIVPEKLREPSPTTPVGEVPEGTVISPTAPVNPSTKQLDEQVKNNATPQAPATARKKSEPVLITPDKPLTAADFLDPVDKIEPAAGDAPPSAPAPLEDKAISSEVLSVVSATAP